MIVTAIKTPKVGAGQYSLFDLVEQSVPPLSEKSVVAVSSKIISLCENRVVSLSANKEDLIRQEADMYLPSSFGKYGYHFSVIKNTLVAAAGIDESNGDDHYVLWPKDPQKTANELRAFLQKKFAVKNIGVIVVDSTSVPMRRGAVGTAIAHTGFKALRSYVGEPDLFDRPFAVSVANVVTGLAASAVLAMGEGNEQTPLCVIGDIGFVEFTNQDPTPKELESIYIPLHDDLYSPFLLKAPWESKNDNQQI